MNDFPRDFEIPALSADPVYYCQLADAARQFFPSLGEAVVVKELRGLPTISPDGRLLVNRAWLDPRGLDGFPLVDTPADEPWGANTLTIAARVLLPAAHAQTAELVSGLGHEVEVVDISEFAKAEGGVTCLSILLDG